MGILQLRPRFSGWKESGGPRPADSCRCEDCNQRMIRRQEKSNRYLPLGETVEGEMEDAGALEIWGGIECTHNRVGDVYFDQVAWTGHDHRPEDLERFADL